MNTKLRSYWVLKVKIDILLNTISNRPQIRISRKTSVFTFNMMLIDGSVIIVNDKMKMSSQIANELRKYLTDILTELV